MTARRRILAACFAVTAAACAIGPDYQRPSTPVPPAYKEPLPEAPPSAPNAWKPAEPGDEKDRGKWWEAFGDPALNELEEQVTVSNLNIAQAEAQFRGARAAVRLARSDYYPTVTASASATRAQAPKGSIPPGAPTGPTTTYSAPASLAYELDVFGRIRRNVESSVASAQASAADLETVRLTMHADLALDYFALRGLDTEKDLLDTNVEAYGKALQVTVNRFHQGVVSGVDVAQAQTVLETTRAQATDVSVLRAQLEHAIAVLTGKAPADLTLPPAVGLAPPPEIPPGVPSELLERRPDIAASERLVQAANAQIGVAVSAYFPRILLAATGGFTNSNLADWFTLPSRFWSIAPSVVAVLLDGGRRRAITEQAEAAHENAVAVYRLDVLTAFQDVEDNLAALRLLAEESSQQAAAAVAAEKALTQARNRYLQGVTTYLEVVTAQVAALNAERTAVEIQVRRLTAAVNLIKALGGGWNVSQLPYAGVASAETPAPAASPAEKPAVAAAAR